MEILVVVLSWLLFGGAASYFASKRGRDPFAWFLIGMLLGILGLLLLFLLPPVKEVEEREEGEEESSLEKAPPESSRWWYYLGNERNQVGPQPISALRKDFDAGKLSYKSYVWSEGMSEWKRLEDLPELIEELGSR